VWGSRGVLDQSIALGDEPSLPSARHLHPPAGEGRACSPAKPGVTSSPRRFAGSVGVVGSDGFTHYCRHRVAPEMSAASSLRLQARCHVTCSAGVGCRFGVSAARVDGIDHQCVAVLTCELASGPVQDRLR